jgi:hypothetical protein
MSKPTLWKFERETALREVLEELRRRNAGKQKREYCRYRATSFTRGYVRIEDGAEVDLARAAMIAAQQLDGRVIRFASTDFCVSVDFLLPQTIAPAKGSKILRRAMSDAYRAKHRGIGDGSTRGYLFKSSQIIETLAPMLGTVLSEFWITHTDEEPGMVGAVALAMGLDDMEDDNDES